MGEAIASVLDDLEPGDEIVAVDDRSTDGGDRVVAALASRDRRVRALASSGEGIVAALTAAVHASRGDLLARMDGDDVSLPGRIAASRAMLDADPSLGAVATQVEPFVDLEGASPSDGIVRYVGWQNSVVTKDDHARAMFVESPVCHPSVTMRRSALEAAGGYEDPPWPEDWDLWLRMHARGIAMAKVPRTLFRWRRHAGALTVTDARYSEERLREARAAYLARHLARGGRPFAVWGAGPTGRRLVRALEAHGAAPRFFIDIDPRRRAARGRPVVLPDEGVPRLLRERAVLVVAVGRPGARDLVRAHLRGRGLVEGADYVCGA